MTQGLRVLVTNLTVAGHRGARSVTRDLLAGLLGAGHRPMLFARTLGPLADDLRRQSIPVTDDIATLGETPDIIHGQHYSVTTLAVARFPDTPAIFVCHDFTAWHDAPPRLPQIRRWAAISDSFRDRLTVEGGVESEAARVVLNAVDLDRFAPGPALPPQPRRALAFAKNLAHLPAIVEACAEAGVELEIVGGGGHRVVAPHEVMGGFDLVFASALTAIEAMAMGRAVIVCDGRGLAGMVDPERYPAWRRENFGLRLLRQPLTALAVAAEIARYDPRAAQAVAAQVRGEAGLPQWISAWEALYREAIADHRDRPLSADATARAMAAHLQAWSSDAGPGFPWMVERAQLIDKAQGDQGLIALAPGEAAEAGDPTRVQLHGFWPAEPWGAWSARAVCSIGVRLRDDVRRLDLTYGLGEGADRRFDFEVLANGLPLASWADEAQSGARSHAIDIPSGTVLPDGRLWLTLRTSEPCAPDGGSGDTRRLGFGLRSLAAR